MSVMAKLYIFNSVRKPNMLMPDGGSIPSLLLLLCHCGIVIAMTTTPLIFSPDQSIYLLGFGHIMCIFTSHCMFQSFSINSNMFTKQC